MTGREKMLRGPLLWYRCRCKKAMVGVRQDSGGERFRPCAWVRCEAGWCPSCKQPILDFVRYNPRGKHPLARQAAKIARRARGGRARPRR